MAVPKRTTKRPKRAPTHTESGFGRLALKVKRMFQLLLCAAILGEIALILALLLEIKLAEPVMIAVDRLKRGRGPLVVRIIAGSVLFLLVARVYGTINIIKRTTMLNPSVLMNMLKISLTVILDRLHHYTREVSLLRTEMEAAQRENQTLKEEKNGRAMELKILGQEIAKLRTNIMNTETEYETKAKGAKLEKTKAYALRKQYEGLLAEIDRVQEDNQILRSQLEWSPTSGSLLPEILDFGCKRKGKRMVQLLLILGQGLVYLLCALIFSEMVLIMTLLFDAPMTKMAILELDSLKLNQGKGLLIVKIVTGTLFLVLMANFYSVLRITMKNRTNEGGGLNPTEEVLKSMNILQISLIGIVLFLVLMIDSLHHYIRGLPSLVMAMEAAKTQNQSFRKEKTESVQKLNTMVQEKDTLRTKLKYLESECESEANEANKARAEAEALRQESEEFLKEYDRLLADNQNFRNQSKLVEQRFTKQSISHPNDKKNLML
ncbi:B-cell receptor-associated 31-like protein [Prunus dulcis]|uniref:B-cell receptor-associated 31-like protein n=2 Tax=Prunus dulcis TaxID=3755 RepID=A0A4Y1R752_PRUDU|nr:B-cell receptor-associated 31-like protein [Prunus dulcis]